MLKCVKCKKVFAEKEAKYCAEYVNMTDERPCYEWYECPHCGSEHIEKADKCECGEYKYRWDILCDDCQKRTLKKFRCFISEFSKKEIEYLNEYFEGKYLEE